MDASLQTSLTVGVAGFFGLLLLNAILAAAHSAMINTRKQTLRDKADAGDRRARSALIMAEKASVLLESRQLVSVLLHFLSLGLLTVFFAAPLGRYAVSSGGNALIPAVIYLGTWLVAGLLMLTLGELLPDIMASAKPESTAILFEPVMRPLFTITSPIARGLAGLSSRTAKVFVGTRDMSYVTEEEIKTLVDAGSEEGVIEDDAKEMIYSIFQFGDKVVSEVMTPRPDVQAMEAKATVVSAMDFVLANGHSRIPVYEDTIDHIIGILYAKDIFRTFRSGGSQVAAVKDFVRPAYFIPASKKAGSLMEELQQRKIHMAIVIDEYGGMAGLITFEDLLEEIVGEIQDEYDPQEEAESTQISDNEYLFDAGIALADVNNMLDVSLPTDESDTLGGYVFAVLGKIPLAGETFTASGLEFRVEVIVGRRIRKVYVRKLPIVTPEAEAEREREAQRDIREQRDSDRDSERNIEVLPPDREPGRRSTREIRVISANDLDSLGDAPASQQPTADLPVSLPMNLPLPVAPDSTAPAAGVPAAETTGTKPDSVAANGTPDREASHKEISDKEASNKEIALTIDSNVILSEEPPADLASRPTNPSLRSVPMRPLPQTGTLSLAPDAPKTPAGDNPVIITTPDTMPGEPLADTAPMTIHIPAAPAEPPPIDFVVNSKSNLPIVESVSESTTDTATNSTDAVSQPTADSEKTS